VTDAIATERRRRIQLSMWAYAYEIAGEPMVTDEMFDTTAAQSDVSISTGHIDEWWRENFQPYTGCWIHSHPELAQLERRFKERNDS
jgi:hypothetical protein